MPLSNDQLDAIIKQLLTANNPDVAHPNLPLRPPAEFVELSTVMPEQEFESKVEKIIMDLFLGKDEHLNVMKKIMGQTQDEINVYDKAVQAERNKVKLQHFPTNKGGSELQPDGSDEYKKYRYHAIKYINEQTTFVETDKSIQAGNQHNQSYVNFHSADRLSFKEQYRMYAKRLQYERQTLKIEAQLKPVFIQVYDAFNECINGNPYAVAFTKLNSKVDEYELGVNEHNDRTKKRNANNLVITCAKIAYLKYSNWKNENPDKNYHGMSDLEFYTTALCMFFKPLMDVPFNNETYDNMLNGLRSRYETASDKPNKSDIKTFNDLELIFLKDVGLIDRGTSPENFVIYDINRKLYSDYFDLDLQWLKNPNEKPVETQARDIIGIATLFRGVLDGEYKEDKVMAAGQLPENDNNNNITNDKKRVSEDNDPNNNNRTKRHKPSFE